MGGLLVGIDHVAIVVSDYARSKDFYTRVLGLRIVSETYRAERLSYKLDLSGDFGVLLELFSFPDAPARATRPEACGLRHLAFRVASIQQWIERLGSFGVAVESVRRDELTGALFTFFRDPDDLPLELYERQS